MSSTLTVRDCRRRSFILATAGHVDHGKSAMVHRLTQQATDRLPEEKRRGITIDLGFANWLLKDPEQSLLEYDLGLIDVPGHEDFVKNMVTGVGCIDAALLVVAADDGWMPQTEEHFQILNYLGVETIIVVITKIDLTNADPNLVEAMIREELCDTPCSSSHHRHLSSLGPRHGDTWADRGSGLAPERATPESGKTQDSRRPGLFGPRAGHRGDRNAGGWHA